MLFLCFSNYLCPSITRWAKPNHESFLKLFLEIQIAQEWPVDAEVDLSEMDYDEGIYFWKCLHLSLLHTILFHVFY